jgi:hypothetical protein
MAKNNILLYVALILISVVLCSVVIWYVQMFQNYKKEGFSSSSLASLTNSVENECPVSAERVADGRILVQPHNKYFDQMPDYVAWISSLIASGSMCTPPIVKGPREVIVTSDRDTGPNKHVIEKQNRSGNVFTKQVEGEMTSAKTPINKLDDYEYTRIFQNESSPRGELSRSTVNSLMAKNQWDWAKLPFNSEIRKSAEDDFVAGRADSAFRDPKTGVYFKAVEGFSVNPPDVGALDEKEKAILEPFKSKPAERLLLQHDLTEVAALVKKMYADDPNWEPVIEKVNDHEYRVAELRPRLKKEKYAGEEEQTIERAKESGKIQAAVTVEGGNKDPYFDKNGVVDYSNDRFWEYKDFKKWTPGLERMFAPTLDTNNWS